jgi:hypothetical protein
VKRKKHESSGSDQFLAELHHEGGEILVSVIHKRFTSFWNAEELHDQWK